MDPVRWLGLIRNVMVGREGLDRSVLLDLAARAGRRELVAQRPVPWLQELESVDRFTGYDPDEWVFEVAFVRHDPPRSTSRCWTTRSAPSSSKPAQARCLRHGPERAGHDRT
jgi:hypothetical protein